MPNIGDGELEPAELNGICCLRGFDVERELSLGVAGEYSISGSGSAGFGVGGSGFQLVTFSAEPVVQSPAGFDVLAVLLNNGDMWVSAKDGDVLLIQVGDVDDVNSGKFVVGWFRSLMVEIAFWG